jgi:tripartite-type tricarboxylate transporter receptor subunit TctC
MRLLIAIAALLATLAAAQARDYPTRPIRLIVTFPAGGAIDVLSRVLADRLTAELGERVVVEDRAGMGGTLGAYVAAKAPPDGYTLVTASAASHAINKALFRSIPYDPEADFTPISLFASLPTVLVVHPSLPVHTVAEFIAEAKRRPGRINYASVGNGSSQHLAGAYFELRAGVRLQHVPYQTIGAISSDLVSDEVQAGFLFISNILSFIESGQVRALAVTSRTRIPVLAGVPTMVEAGLPDYEYVNWFGVMGPAGLPPEIVDRLHRAIAVACRDPALQQRFAALGALTDCDDPASFARFVHDEIPKWDAIVKASGAQID